MPMNQTHCMVDVLGKIGWKTLIAWIGRVTCGERLICTGGSGGLRGDAQLIRSDVVEAAVGWEGSLWSPHFLLQ
jgi:hypothetical protein